MAFRFKQFTVEDDRSTLRVGTDAMLLGAWAKPGKAERILDIGTGCGVLSLMLAQKSQAQFDAIEIDPDSAAQAAVNFSRSPWAERLSAIHTSLEAFTSAPLHRYGFIISNPPYFHGHLKSPSTKLNMAKHEAGLDIRNLITGTRKVLDPCGRISLVYPCSLYQNLKKAFEREGFVVSREMIVRPAEGREPGRVLAEFNLHSCDEPERAEISILGPDGKYTRDYLDLTREYHSF